MDARAKKPKIGLPLFLAALGRTFLFGLDGSPVRFTVPRLLAMFFYMPLVLLLAGMHAIGFMLDNIFFRTYRNVEVRRPLFVVGPPRCGTTFLQRVLARDTENVTCFTLGEMVFAPSITEKKVFRIFGKIDNCIGRPVQKLVGRAEGAQFAELNELHRVSFFEPEEDYMLLAYIVANPIMLAAFPFWDLFGHLWRFDQETPPRQRERVMAYYKRCVQRHLHFHGTDKRFLSKNPYFTPMLQSVAETFPDARFVCNVRSPYESVPSMIGMWQVFYGYFKNDPNHYLARDFVVDYMQEFYRYVAERLEDMPQDRICLVPYNQLRDTVRESVHQLYRRFGYELTETYDARLVEEQRKADAYTSSRKTGLEDYGLSREDIRQKFEEVFRRFEFETGDLAGRDD